MLSPEEEEQNVQQKLNMNPGLKRVFRQMEKNCMYLTNGEGILTNFLPVRNIKNRKILQVADILSLEREHVVPAQSPDKRQMNYTKELEKYLR